MELTKKLSSKTIMGKPIAEFITDDPRPLYHVMGVAVATKKGTSAHGEYIGLRGNFEAVVCETGEVKKSPMLFLPDIALDLILGELIGTQSVQFAMTIGIRRPVTGEIAPFGYIYTCNPLTELSEGDPLSDLRKQLPAPDKKPKA